MKPPTELLLTANALIHQHDAGAEEYVAQQLWDSGRKKNQTHADYWRSMVEALKWVRKLRAEIKQGS
jgi:protein tyrosine/serine phosphatase